LGGFRAFPVGVHLVPDGPNLDSLHVAVTVLHPHRSNLDPLHPLVVLYSDVALRHLPGAGCPPLAGPDPTLPLGGFRAFPVGVHLVPNRPNLDRSLLGSGRREGKEYGGRGSSADDRQSNPATHSDHRSPPVGGPVNSGRSADDARKSRAFASACCTSTLGIAGGKDHLHSALQVFGNFL
jgi:hypothetical protein